VAAAGRQVREQIPPRRQPTIHLSSESFDKHWCLLSSTL
jgi:hypothetical protein